jgi:hypothetical protein
VQHREEPPKIDWLRANEVFDLTILREGLEPDRQSDLEKMLSNGDYRKEMRAQKAIDRKRRAVVVPLEP